MEVTKNINLKVVHILPAMNFGGVEVGIKKSYSVLNSFFDYKVVTVLFKGKINCNQVGIFSFLVDVIFGKGRPNIVVTSLWIAHPFGFFFKLFGIKWIAFFHNASYTHNLDKFFLKFAAYFADECIADSVATQLFMSKTADRKYDIVPYIFPVNSHDNISQRTNDFVWIGRNHDQKRLDLVCKFIFLLAKQIKSARLSLVVSGSDYEPFSTLQNINGWDVKIYNSIPNDEVAQILSASRFYILLSDFEGMSMSTIEAIQAGCVPVVRAVGEIGSYLDNQCAIIVQAPDDKDLEEASLRVKHLWQNEEELVNMKKISICKIQNMGNYCDSFVAAIIN